MHTHVFIRIVYLRYLGSPLNYPLTGTHQHGRETICDRVAMVLWLKHRLPLSACSPITIKANRKYGYNYVRMGELIGGIVIVICRMIQSRKVP